MGRSQDCRPGLQSAGQELARGCGAEEGQLHRQAEQDSAHDRGDEGMRQTEEDFSATICDNMQSTVNQGALVSRAGHRGMEHHLGGSPSRDLSDTAWPKAHIRNHFFSINYLAWRKVPNIQKPLCQEQYSKGLEGISQEMVKSQSFFFFFSFKSAGFEQPKPTVLPFTTSIYPAAYLRVPLGKNHQLGFHLSTEICPVQSLPSLSHGCSSLLVAQAIDLGVIFAFSPPTSQI